MWQLSLAFQTPQGPLPTLRWSVTKRHKAEAIRDRIMHCTGTDEPWVTEVTSRTVQYRRPLRIDEVNQLAPTPEVRERPGRP